MGSSPIVGTYAPWIKRPRGPTLDRRRDGEHHFMKRKPYSESSRLLRAIPEGEFLAIVQNSKSIGEALRALKSTASYAFRQILQERSIDTSHFVRYFNPRKYSASEIFAYRGRGKASLLRRGLIEIGRDPRCEMPGCNVTNNWLGRPITLQIDHINGDNTDNRPENLRYACPNCHSQTDTWGKHKRNMAQR